MRLVTFALATAAVANFGSTFRPMRAAFGSRPRTGLHGQLRMRCAVAVVLVVAWWATTSVAAAPPANGVAITSVSPSPATRSERVTVTGHGFGDGNVTVRLGGQLVLPDVALGSKLEFVVPEYSPVGDLPLELVNPGGITATASLTVLFDGRVQPVVDRALTVTRSIGPAGGTITVGTTTLTIPPGALLVPEDISMSPLDSLVGSPLSPVYDAVQLEPSGLRLLKPAQLSMPLRASAADFATFLYDGSGEDMHLAPYSISGQTVTVQVSHFSGGGSGGAANAPSMYSFSPSNAQAHAEQQIAAALLMLEQGRVDETLFNAMVDQALRIWYASVINGFQVALGGPIEYFEFAIGDWLAWRAQVTLLDRDAALALQVSTSQDVARGVAIAHARRILATCTGRDPDPFAGVAEIIHLVGLLELDPQSSTCTPWRPTWRTARTWFSNACTSTSTCSTARPCSRGTARTTR